jgi:hypothetical protein
MIHFKHYCIIIKINIKININIKVKFINLLIPKYLKLIIIYSMLITIYLMLYFAIKIRISIIITKYIINKYIINKYINKKLLFYNKLHFLLINLSVIISKEEYS